MVARGGFAHCYAPDLASLRLATVNASLGIRSSAEPYRGRHAIDHLNREQGKLLNTPERKDLLNENAELATDLSQRIRGFVNYRQTRAKCFELRRRLELSERAPRS